MTYVAYCGSMILYTIYSFQLQIQSNLTTSLCLSWILSFCKIFIEYLFVWVYVWSVLSDSATLWMVRTQWTTRLLCSWNFPGKNTGFGCQFLLQGYSQHTDWIEVSCVSCIGRQILYHCATWKPHWAPMFTISCLRNSKNHRGKSG